MLQLDFRAELEDGTYVDWAKLHERAKEVKKKKAEKKKQEKAKREFIENYPCLSCLAGLS